MSSKTYHIGNHSLLRVEHDTPAEVAAITLSTTRNSVLEAVRRCIQQFGGRLGHNGTDSTVLLPTCWRQTNQHSQSFEDVLRMILEAARADS